MNEHPGEHHTFSIACERCGKRGYVNLSVIAPDEVIAIESTRSRVWPGDPEYHEKGDVCGRYTEHIHLVSSRSIVFAA